MSPLRDSFRGLVLILGLNRWSVVGSQDPSLLPEWAADSTQAVITVPQSCSLVFVTLAHPVLAVVGLQYSQ